MGTIFFLALLVAFGGANLLWWRVVDRRVRRFGRRGEESGGCAAARRWCAALRWGTAAFAVGMVAYVALVGTLGGGRAWHSVPMPIHVFAYLWNLLVLPVTLICVAAGMVGVWGATILKRFSEVKEGTEDPAADDGGRRLGAEEGELPSRRRVLGMAAVAVPPLMAVGFTGVAEAELGGFRIRPLALPVAGLPGDLEGLTIAHVTDVHIGRFLPAGTLPRIVAAVRKLSADIVVFTGDALDTSQREIEPVVEFLRDLRPGAGRGYAIVEGNHDVSHGAEWFESTIMGAGLPLLLDDSMTVRLPGRATPIWLGGISWGKLVPGRTVGQLGEAGRRMTRRNDEAAMAESVSAVAAQRAQSPGAYPILLVHHPHAFDAAAAHGLPLVLAGHTHGGQIMLTRNIGAGPMRFRYWSGTHRIGDSRMVISNGVGNWFPLRINAPTEIVHITLRRKI